MGLALLESRTEEGQIIPATPTNNRGARKAIVLISHRGGRLVALQDDGYYGPPAFTQRQVTPEALRQPAINLVRETLGRVLPSAQAVAVKVDKPVYSSQHIIVPVRLPRSVMSTLIDALAEGSPLCFVSDKNLLVGMDDAGRVFNADSKLLIRKEAA